MDDPGNISETDSDYSDVIIVRKKQKIRIIESDFKDINKPKVAVNYTNSMGGVDIYASSYCFLRKSMWWRKRFFCGMEITSVNSYILYNSVKKKKK